MLHPRLGDDPQWALYRLRERLDLTDPPTATTPRPRGARRWTVAVLAALTLAASARSDTDATAPPLAPVTTAPAVHPLHATQAVTPPQTAASAGGPDSSTSS